MAPPFTQLAQTSNLFEKEKALLECSFVCSKMSSSSHRALLTVSVSLRARTTLHPETLRTPYVYLLKPSWLIPPVPAPRQLNCNLVSGPEGDTGISAVGQGDHWPSKLTAAYVRRLGWPNTETVVVRRFSGARCLTCAQL